MNQIPDHHVIIRSGRRVIENWTSYDVSIDMLQPADQFVLQLGPADPVGGEFGKVWEAVKPDSLVEVLLDDVVILSGFIDDRQGSSDMGGDTISINGRDRAGRLVDESMPLVSFNGRTLKDLAYDVASPWFDHIEMSNDRNRKLAIGEGRGAKGGKTFKRGEFEVYEKPSYRKVEPGETRWNVLQHFLHQNDLLAWSSVDGKTLIIGRPNYDQAPTFQFFHPAAESRRQAEANVSSFRVSESVAERYSQIIAMGASSRPDIRGPGETKRVAVKHKGAAVNGPGPYGVGKDFQHRKVLLMPDDSVKNDRTALKRSEKEMAQRDAKKQEISLTVYGHSQSRFGARAPTLYACDTIALVESEVFGIRGEYLITSVRFHRDAGGPITDLQLVPKGTKLAQ